MPEAHHTDERGSAKQSRSLRVALSMVTTTENSSVDLIAESVRQRILQEKGKAPAEAEAKPRDAGQAPGKARRQHYKFTLLLAAVRAGVDAVALVGPAGTGKTTAAHECAKRLGRRFEATSFGPTTSKADLFGFVDANGVYRATGLVRAASAGGVFLGDELDAGHPGVITGLNMVLANCSFGIPTGMIEKHPEFVPIFGMNTYGAGANRQYVGRNQLDAASLDRMVILEWDLDEGLEAEMCGVQGVPSPGIDLAAGGTMTAPQWLARVWTVRKAIDELGVRHIVSPRCSQNGIRLFKVGLARKHVEQMVLWKGMDADTKARVQEKARELGGGQ